MGGRAVSGSMVGQGVAVGKSWLVGGDNAGCEVDVDNEEAVAVSS